VKNFQAVGFICTIVFAFCAATAVSAFAEGEWLAGGSMIRTALAADTSGALHLINLKSSGGGVLLEIECNYLFEGTVGPGGAGTVTDLINLSGETIGGLGDTNEKKLNCTVTATAKELGDCTATGELMEVLPTNLNLELGTSWATEVLLMELAGIHYYLNGFPAVSGYEVKCKTSLGELENKCEGATSAFLENMEAEKGVLGTFGKEKFGTEEEESEATNCNLTGEKTGTLSGSGLTTLVPNTETLTVSE
jgi:hypothetical protein